MEICQQQGLKEGTVFHVSAKAHDINQVEVTGLPSAGNDLPASRCADVWWSGILGDVYVSRHCNKSLDCRDGEAADISFRVARGHEWFRRIEAADEIYRHLGRSQKIKHHSQNEELITKVSMGQHI